MRDRSSPHNASLLDILVDGFEKNEMFDGYHWHAGTWAGDPMGEMWRWLDG